jgi:hypothetical protein
MKVHGDKEGGRPRGLSSGLSSERLREKDSKPRRRRRSKEKKSFPSLPLTVQSSSGSRSSSSGISSPISSPSPTEAAGGVEGDEANAATRFNCRRSVGMVVAVVVLKLAACLGALTAAVHLEKQVFVREDIFVDARIAVRREEKHRRALPGTMFLF